jgi:hypothetical protein
MRNHSRCHHLSPTSESSTRAASSILTEQLLTSPLIPRCCRRSPPPPRVTGVPPPWKNFTAPLHLRPPPWTARSGDPRYPPPCPAPPRCRPQALCEDLMTKESPAWLWQPRHRRDRGRGEFQTEQVRWVFRGPQVSSVRILTLLLDQGKHRCI